MTVHSPNSSPPTVKSGAAEFATSSAMSNCVQVEVVGATDLPKIEGFGLANPFVSISLFGHDVGPASALMSMHDTIKVTPPLLLRPAPPPNKKLHAFPCIPCRHVLEPSLPAPTPSPALFLHFRVWARD